MTKIFYTKQLLISEIAIIIIALLSIRLINYAESIEEYFLSNTLKAVLIIGDVCISFGIMVGASFNGAIVIFFLFRVILQIFCQSISYSQVFLPAILCYVMFKALTIILVKINKLQGLDGKDLSIRQKVVQCEQKKRQINILVFSITLFFMINYYLNHTIPFASFGIYATYLICLIVEVYVMNKAEQTLFKLIANSFSYNLYLYIGMSVIFGRIFYNNYGEFIKPTIILLITLFLLIRMFMGSKSSKFHSSDLILFEMTYIFKGIDGDKYYRQNKNYLRTLRIMDKVSRQIILIIYYLSIFAALYFNSYLYLFVSIALLLNYPLQQQAQFKTFTYIKQKLNFGFKLRFKLIFPIILLVYTLVGKECTRKQQLFDAINQCSLINNLQIPFLATIFSAIFLNSLFSIKIQSKIFGVVQLVCPLIVAVWVLWLQCVNSKLILLGVYVLIYCLQQIREGRQIRLKGGKKQ